MFEFKLDLECLEAKVNKDTNRIDLIDINTKKLKANIEAPNIIDKSGMADYDHVHYELKTDEEGGYILSVIVDTDYINNAKYPITIDPTYTWVNDSMIEYGATLNVGGAASSVLNKASNITLMNSSSTKGRLYIKFEGLNEQLRGKYVYYSYFAAHTANSSGSIAVGASKILGDWDENTLTWNTQPEISDVYYDVEATFTNDGVNTYTLTQWTKEIAAGEINDDYGIALSCVGAENQSAVVNMYPLFTTGKLATFYVHYMDVEEVNSEYDGSFQMETNITDENKVELSWDKFSDDVCEYNIYVRTANKFNLIGRTTELEYTVDESYLGDYTDIRVMAIECGTDMAFYSAENYLSNIVSIQKCTEEDPVTEDDITEPLGLEIDSLSSLDVNTLSNVGDIVETTTVTSYEQTILDTDGDELEDGYEIWDLKTLWNTETSDSTEDNRIYDLDTDDDGFPDSYEVFTLGTDPAVANDEEYNSDDDDWSDLEEYNKGTDPHLWDSDFDNVKDSGDATPRITNSSTSQTVATETSVYIGPYDKTYTVEESRGTCTYVENIYNGVIKSVDYNYGDENLNKKIKYFYDMCNNQTAIIEQYNSTSTQTICITFSYDKDNNNVLICDQNARYTMTYNEKGLRIYKDTSSKLITYEWDDERLVREIVTYKQTGNVYDIWYLYDVLGKVIGFEYSFVNDINEKNAVRIYFEKDYLGNVIGLLDSRGAEIATYSYDAWGNITDTVCYEGNEIAYSLNNITYKSYYRDEETKFYYLQTRYYDPEICRFINADDIQFLGKSGTLLSYNLYTYCESNPVLYKDPRGQDKHPTFVMDICGFNIINKTNATQCIDAFVSGAIYESKEFSDELYDTTLEWWAKNGKYTSIKKFGIINNKDYDRYDDYILGFANYWISKKKYSYLPRYIKAMLVIESNMGYYTPNNGSRDVMQCLDARNPAVYCMAKIKPTNGVAYDKNEGVAYGIPKEGYYGVKKLFVNSKPKANKVTVKTSICFGIFWLGYKTKVKGSKAEGVKAYNGGDSQYFSKVKNCSDNPAKWIKKNK